MKSELPIVAALLVALAVPAGAQLATISPTELIQLGKAEVTQLKQFALQANQYIQEAQSAISLGQVVSGTIAHPNIGSVMALANTVGIENPIGIDPFAVQGLLSGYGGAGISGMLGKFSMLGAAVNTAHSNDAFYSCHDNSFSCQQSQQVSWSNAGLKGITSQVYQQLANHIPVLQGLRAQLATSTTPAERENIMAQVAIENTWALNAGNTLQAAIATSEAQERVAHQQHREKLMMDADQMIALARTQ